MMMRVVALLMVVSFFAALLPGDAFFYRGGDGVVRELMHVPAGDRCLARICAGTCEYHALDPGDVWLETTERPRLECMAAGGYMFLYATSGTKAEVFFTFAPDVSGGGEMSEGR